MMTTSLTSRAFKALLAALALVALGAPPAFSSEHPENEAGSSAPEKSMQVQYLEIVTPDVEKTCAALSKLHGITFSDPQEGLGQARIAALESGGRIGVRAPLADHDHPIVRPYILVGDLEEAIQTAEEAGAEFAMKATEIPGHGTFAIYFLGGTQYGLWQL